MFSKLGVLCSLLAPNSALMALAKPLERAEQRDRIPWGVWLLIIVFLLALLILWWLRSEEEEKAAPPAEPEPAPKPAPKAAPKPAKPDDLKRIEGIGPKISKVLAEAGIATFAELAKTPVARLEQILDEASIRIANPGTWPEQASLAAAGKWTELEKLQDSLKGGRRA